jgi:ADP-heptose:LPS heptosyltransferase
MSVAGALGVVADTIPAAVPYVTADPARRSEIAATLALHGRSLNVGLAWTGSKHHANDRRRSMALATLAPLFALPGIAWFTLQKEDDESEAATAAAAGIRRVTTAGDFDDSASLAAQTDLVITVDTGIAHLAGALARPTWVLLPFAPDWRWRLDRHDSPWYPTMRLFRQPRPGDWDQVVREVATALRELAVR